MSVFDTTLLGACAGLEGRGGLLTSVFSCVLLAELAVGRIMRAKNPSSTGLVALPLLTRECGRSWVDCGDERGACLRALEAVGVVARALAPLTAVFEVDGLRVRLVVAAVAGAPVFVLLDWVGAVAEERRLGLVGDFGLVLGVEEFALFASRAGVVEVRLVRGADLAAVFNDVRLGLDATALAGSLVASFVVTGLAVRVVLVISDLAGEVSVRLMGDFARDALGAAGLFTSLLGSRAFDGSFAAGFEADFWDASSEAGAAEPLNAGCASCGADAGAFSAFVVVSLLPSSAAALVCCLFGDACCSPVVAIPRPFPVGEGSTGLFWLASVSRSSE